MNESSVARRAFWRKTLNQWHWISAALSLAGMLLFAVTGLLLNNAAWWESDPEVHTYERILPDAILAHLKSDRSATSEQPSLPAPVHRWLEKELNLRISAESAASAEFSANEIYLSLPRPGADAWLRMSLDSGTVEYERSDYGWIAYFNDLHKGRNTGAVWGWFIDVFALACIIFTLSGLALLVLHARQRQSTWPLTTLGLIAPLILMLLFIH